jgi:hypothetical protein
MSDYEPGDTMVEALRRANPVPLDPAVSRRSRPSANARFAEIVAERPRRVRRRVLVIVIAIALIALMLMAFVMIRRESGTLAAAPACYAADSLTAPRVIASGDSPAHACAALWESGRFGTHGVPKFDVCVLPSGVAAVFPGESGSVCAKLDLPEESGDDRLERFADSVNRQVSGACVDAERADEIVQAELSHVGLAGWTVVPARPFDAEHPCATIAFNDATKTIHFVGIANPFPAPTAPAP